MRCAKRKRMPMLAYVQLQKWLRENYNPYYGWALFHLDPDLQSRAFQLWNDVHTRMEEYPYNHAGILKSKIKGKKKDET